MYCKDTYNVYRTHDGFVIHNVRKKFSKGHSHLKSFNSCKDIIDIVINKTLPQDLDLYRMESLARVSDDDEYCERVRQLIRTKKDKRDGNSRYYNKRRKRYIRC